MYDLKALMTYQHVDDKGKDQGINVRNRAKEIVLLLQSPDRIREERSKAKSNRDKYVGVSNETAAFGGTKSYASRNEYDDDDSSDFTRKSPSSRDEFGTPSPAP